MKTYEEFIGEIHTLRKTYPSYIRKGQGVFNAVEEIYGPDVARYVQCNEGIDCFYDDSMITAFLVCCYNRYMFLEKEKDGKDK